MRDTDAGRRTMLTTTKIRKMANKSAYDKGMQIRYSKKRVLNFQVKRQQGLRRGSRGWDLSMAEVRGSNGEIYHVELEYDAAADELLGASCECLAFQNYEGLCKHCVAVGLMYADWQVKQKLYRDESEETPEKSDLPGISYSWLPESRAGDGSEGWSENGQGSRAADEGTLAGSISDRVLPGSGATVNRKAAMTEVTADRQATGMQTAAGQTAGRKTAGQAAGRKVTAGIIATGAGAVDRMPVPKERTSEIMKQMLEKQTRRRTAPVTEQQVYGKVQLEPTLELGLGNHRDELSFRVGADKMYVLKDLGNFAWDVMAQREHAYGKKLGFTHTMEAFAPESRPLVDFILRRFQGLADQRNRNLMQYGREPVLYIQAQRTVSLGEKALEELIEACGDRPILVSIETAGGKSSPKPYCVTDGWPKHPLLLRGEYVQQEKDADAATGQAAGRDAAAGKTAENGTADDQAAESGRAAADELENTSKTLTGLRGETGELVVRRGRRNLYAFEDGWIYRISLSRIAAIEDWLLQLSPRPHLWAWEREDDYLRRRRGGAGAAEPRVEKFFVERADVPAFCREILPQLKSIFNVRCENFLEEDFAMSRATFRFYLDSPGKDVVTCRAEAWYGDQKYSLYEGVGDGGTGIGRRDLLEELAVSQALKTMLPVSGAGGEHMLVDDESALYDFLTEGINSLQNLGGVFVSDALRRMEVRPAPRVSVGVSLSGDLLELSMQAEGLSRQELAEILSRYDRKKKYHRLKNGDFVQLDGEELAALAEMEQGLGLSEKQLAKEVVELPRFRALYLDSQMREKESLPVERSRDFRALVRNMKTVEDNDFEVPDSLKKVLRSYQKKGFLWLKTLAAAGFGGILADDMGLGKTLQVIAFLLSEMEEGQNRPTLIVCPASLVYNWENEIRRFAPQLPVQVIAGSAAERAEMIGKLSDGGSAAESAGGKQAASGKKPGTTQAVDSAAANGQAADPEPVVCITSYELLRRDVEQYENVNFGCQVIDEAQYIKNHGTKAAHAVKKVRSGFRIALTGTPIENRLSELWSIFDYLMPGFLYSYEQFHKRIEKPVVGGQNEEVMGLLQKMISPFVLRRLKKDVLRDLPDKIEENMMTRLEGEQRELYEAQVQALKQMLENQSEEEFRQSRISVLASLTRLRQICCDPALIYEGYRGPAAKVELCMDMVENGIEGGHKMLLFSQFTSMLQILEEHLQKAGISYYKLTGATPKEERIRLVEDFNREDSTAAVFLISLKAGGTGLNLTAADVVLHFDPWWNLAVQNQATDRAHRIGQKQVVNVYKLIARDTIEENIVRLQERKRELADRVLGGEGLGSGTFSRDELLEILG